MLWRWPKSFTFAAAASLVVSTALIWASALDNPGQRPPSLSHSIADSVEDAVLAAKMLGPSLFRSLDDVECESEIGCDSDIGCRHCISPSTRKFTTQERCGDCCR